MGNESDRHGKKRLKADFKASLLGPRDTYGLEDWRVMGLAATQVAAFERQEWISWDSAKVSPWPVRGFQAQSQNRASWYVLFCL